MGPTMLGSIIENNNDYYGIKTYGYELEMSPQNIHLAYVIIMYIE